MNIFIFDRIQYFARVNGFHNLVFANIISTFFSSNLQEYWSFLFLISNTSFAVFLSLVALFHTAITITIPSLLLLHHYYCSLSASSVILVIIALILGSQLLIRRLSQASAPLDVGVN